MPDTQKQIPEPIRMAQEALKQLEAEGLATDVLRKALPAYAMQQARKGEDVSIEILLNASRSGEALAKEKASQARNYEDIVKKIKLPEAIKNEQAVTDIIKAARADDFEKLKQLCRKSPPSEEEVKESLLAAARSGNLQMVKYLFDRHNGKGDPAQVWLAALAGSLDVIKYLVEKKNVDAHAGHQSALANALQRNHIHIIRYFIDLPGTDLADNNNYLTKVLAFTGYLDDVKLLVDKKGMAADSAVLAWAAMGKQKYVMKYLIEEKGLDINANRGEALLGVVPYRDLDIIMHLVENLGADVNLRMGTAFVRAAEVGAPVQILEYFISRGINMRIVGPRALSAAAKHGRFDTVYYLAEQQGVMPGPTALRHAVEYSHRSLLHYFVIDKGMDLSRLPKQMRKKAERILKTSKPEDTMQIDGALFLRDQDPAFARPKAYAAIRKFLIEKESIGTKEASVAAYAAAALFGTEERVLQYFEAAVASDQMVWSGKPLYSLLTSLKLPFEKTVDLDIAAWGDAVIKCGAPMSGLFRYADRMSVPAKSDDGRTWSMANTRDALALKVYSGARKNPELARLCMEYRIAEDLFAKAFRLAKAAPQTKNIPSITIDGAEFGMDGATFHPLPANDVRALFLGELVNNCQSIGKVGEKCAVSGFKSTNEGFYVIEDRKGQIIGEVWAWRGKDGELVFDSQETLGERVNADQWQGALQAFARAVERDEASNDIKALHVGVSGYAGTPRKLSATFNKAASPAIPMDHEAYVDSREQLVVWTRKPELKIT